MGKWSRHPLGSDQVSDIQDTFLAILQKDPNLCYLDLKDEEIKKELLLLSVEEIKEQISINKELSNNRFVIPYSYLEYGALSINKEMRLFLKDCLNYHAIFSFKDHAELNHIARFIKHFDEVFNGEYDLENDQGLIQAINESKETIVNLSDNDYFGVDYDFSKYLKCGVCGEVFKKKQQKRNALYICNARYKRGSKGCINKGVPDDKLVLAINELLNISTFDPEVFEKKVKEIIVFENNILEFHFLDGTIKQTTWQERDNKEQWTLDKRRESRANSMCCASIDDYPLRDKLLCGDCGNYYVHKKKKEGYVYVCRTNRRLKTDQCSNVPYKEKDLLNYISRLLDIKVFNKELFNEKIKYLVLYPNKNIKVIFNDGNEIIKNLFN